MKALCLYVKAGKGHYVPAKAVCEQLAELGIDAELDDFFSILDLNWLEKINQGVWRFMLKVPFFERRFIKSIDKSTDGIKAAVKLVKILRKRKLAKLMAESAPDFIFTTHPYPGTILSVLLTKMGLNIPVYYYATDVFTAPISAACPYLRKLYISTTEGVDRVAQMETMDKDKIVLCPFPLQSSVANQPMLSKKDAREKLGLDPDMFTIQLNLGGEGLGSLYLLEDILRKNLTIQFVRIGGINDSMRGRIEHIISEYGSTKAHVEIRGFIDNVSDYLAASDIIVGRAGINTMLETMYAHRPFLITELVYTVIPSAEYVEKYKVGWNADGDRNKQIEIVEKLFDNPELLDEIEGNFKSIPIEYSAKHLAEMLVKDVESYKMESCEG